MLSPTLFAVQSGEQGAARIRVHARMGGDLYTAEDLQRS